MRKQLEFLGLVAFFSLCLGAAFGGGYYVRAWSAEYAALRWDLPGLPAAADYPLLAEARALLLQHFNGPLPEARAQEYGLIRGYVGAFDDPYTVFVEPPAAELQSQALQGDYGGIGVELSVNAAGAIELKPFPDSPAEAAGLQAGDLLIRVDDQTITPDMTLDAVTALVRGLVGTPVRITVRRADGAEPQFTITRQSVPLPSATWTLVAGQPEVGLIAINRFSDRTAEEVARAGRELTAQGARRFVLDLRNNGGGLLDSAVEVAGQFLDGGVVMYETSRAGPERTFTAPVTGGPLTRVPLAVLVNGNTASAAEILAGALLDRERAPLIGQPTFGKGSVQYVFPLSDGSSLHVTANLWFTPARREFTQGGLPPSLAVEPAADGQDAELAQAVQYLAEHTQP